MRKQKLTLFVLTFLCMALAMLSSCSKRGDEWREEIRLANGDLIIADMKNFYGDGDITVAHGPLVRSSIEWEYKGKKYKWMERAVAPVAVQIDTAGRFYVVSTIQYRWACIERGAPESFYVIFRYENTRWSEVPLSEIDVNTVFNIAGTSQPQHGTEFRSYVKESDWKFKDDTFKPTRSIVPGYKSNCYKKSANTAANHSLKADAP